MCKLQSLIKEKFPESTQVLTQLSPDEVIALGCAKQSFLITNSKSKKLTQSDNQFQCLSDEILMLVNALFTKMLTFLNLFFLDWKRNK